MNRIGPPSITRIRSIESTLRRALLAIGFWGAIALPLLGIPLLAILPASADVVAIGLIANVVCLVVGQRHDPTTGWLGRSSDRRIVRKGIR